MLPAVTHERMKTGCTERPAKENDSRIYTDDGSEKKTGGEGAENGMDHEPSSPLSFSRFSFPGKQVLRLKIGRGQ